MKKESIGWRRASDTAQWTVNASANIPRDTYMYGTRVSYAKSHPCVWKRDSVHKWLPTGNQRYEMTETGRTRETRIRLETLSLVEREYSSSKYIYIYSGITISVNGSFENVIYTQIAIDCSRWRAENSSQPFNSQRHVRNTVSSLPSPLLPFQLLLLATIQRETLCLTQGTQRRRTEAFERRKRWCNKGETKQLCRVGNSREIRHRRVGILNSCECSIV